MKKPLGLGAGAPGRVRVAFFSDQPGKPGPLSFSQFSAEWELQPAEIRPTQSANEIGNENRMDTDLAMR